MASMYGGQSAQAFGQGFGQGMGMMNDTLSKANRMKIASQDAKDRSAQMLQKTNLLESKNARIDGMENEISTLKKERNQSDARGWAMSGNSFMAQTTTEDQQIALDGLKNTMTPQIMKLLGMQDTQGLRLVDADKDSNKIKQYIIDKTIKQDTSLSAADVAESITDEDIAGVALNSNLVMNKDKMVDLTILSAATGWSKSVRADEAKSIEGKTDLEIEGIKQVAENTKINMAVRAKELQFKIDAKTQELDVALGLKKEFAPSGKGIGKAQSPFGKFHADMVNMGFPEEMIPDLYAKMEKNPTHTQALKNLAKKNIKPTVENVDKEVRSIKGTLDTKAPTGTTKETAITAYDKMIAVGKDNKVDFNKPDAMNKFNALGTVEQGRMKASAKEYFKEASDKLMPPDVLARHLHTLKSLNVDPSALDESIKSAAGWTDSMANSVKQYLTTDEGIEFTKQFKQTFNNLLLAGNKGHISKAELDNMSDAFGNLSKSNEAVFTNFRSMVDAMRSKVQAYKTTSPVAAEILYGTELKAYDTVMGMMDSIDATGTAKVVPTKENAQQYNFSGD